MNQTRIEYLGYTSNPIVGCSGFGCAVRLHCWAMAMAKRQKHRCSLCYNFEPHYHRERLEESLHLKKPSIIGLNFMGETFDKLIHDYCPYVWTEMFDMMKKASWHTFVILTKQPQNVPHRVMLPKNLWLGSSVNRRDDLWRINELKGTTAQLIFLSCEPLYEDLGEIDLTDIHWIIIGAQTRPNVQPKEEWVYSLSHQASELNIPVFWKSNLSNIHGKRREFPEAKK